MAFVLKLHTATKQNYIKNFIINIIKEFDIKTDVVFQNEELIFSFDKQHPKLKECLDKVASTLPASLFLKSSTSYEDDSQPLNIPSVDNHYPLNIGLCSSCQKEMLDVSSSRYYYPFTSCNCCGGNYSFLNSYPYERKNTSFKFLMPCDSCKDEMQNLPKKDTHHINSCHSCGVPVRLISKNSERYANDAGSFRTMFEVTAKAIQDDKKVLIKTTMGYRVFYKADRLNDNSILMMIDSSCITDNLALITEEFNALLSIERPILDVTLKNENLKSIKGSNTAYVKYPDDGFCILLGTELQKLEVQFIAYEEVDANFDADMTMEYDLEITSQSDMRYFLNKDIAFIAEGQRVSFPSANFEKKNVLSISDSLVGLPNGETMFFDTMEHFKEVEVLKANVLETIDDTYHSNQIKFNKQESSFLSVVAEHNLFGRKCVGAYFDEEPSFLYYDGKNIITIIPPKEFDATTLLDAISSLREGSDKLIKNLQSTKPEIYKKLKSLQDKKGVKLFEAVAIILGLRDESMRGVTKEAMKFVGKGGIQIDTHVKDNRFDHNAFLASIISYQLAGVSTAILSYSIFESFGDYFSELIGELKDKTKASEIVLCGTHFANQSLFSRMQRNLKLTPPKMNKNYPIGGENIVVGGVFIST